jgi:hypothetical protein
MGAPAARNSTQEREAIEKAALASTSRRTLQAAATRRWRNFNTKAQALDARVTEWNQRNAKWNETSLAWRPSARTGSRPAPTAATAKTTKRPSVRGK